MAPLKRRGDVPAGPASREDATNQKQKGSGPPQDWPGRRAVQAGSPAKGKWEQGKSKLCLSLPATVMDGRGEEGRGRRVAFDGSLRT